jgi:hypothetical protein
MAPQQAASYAPSLPKPAPAPAPAAGGYGGYGGSAVAPGGYRARQGAPSSQQAGGYGAQPAGGRPGAPAAPGGGYGARPGHVAPSAPYGSRGAGFASAQQVRGCALVCFAAGDNSVLPCTAALG